MVFSSGSTSLMLAATSCRPRDSAMSIRDSAAPRYRTSLTSLSINCESCHGPGRAHVAAVKLMLTRRGGELDREPTEAALRTARAALQQAFDPASASPPAPPAGAAAPAAERLARSALPADLPAQALLPWLERRLQGAVVAADRVARAAEDLRAAVR